MQLLETWRDLVATRQPHSSIRVGDTEAAVAAHDEILTMQFIRATYPWANGPFYGLTLPDRGARELLVQAMKQADFIGLHRRPEWYFRPLAECIMQYYDIRPSQLFYAFENAYISKLAEFYRWFRDVPVLLIGGKAERYRAVLERRYGWTGVVGTVTHWRWTDLEQSRAAMRSFDYRVAIIGAGVAAKVLAADAKAAGNVGIDFGSGIDTCIQSDAEGVDAWDWSKFPKYGPETGEHLREASPPM